MKFDTETIRVIALFENITGATIRDCLINNDTIYVIVDEGTVGIAIGKNGSSVKQAEKMLKKSIKIYEFSSDLVTFVRNLIPQTNDVNIREDGEKVVVEIKVNKSEKAIVIGRDRKNLKLYKELLQRNHRIDDLIVR